MSLTPKQAEEIKEQLLEQVNNLPSENKEQIKKYIESLDEEQLEEFLKKNKIKISSEGNIEQDEETNEEKIQEKKQECIFCQIAKNKIPSYKIAENKKSIAILEINPLSKAHSIVLPIEHRPIEKIPKSSLSLAQKIAKKMKKKLKPEDIKIETTNFQGHALINIIPIYKDSPLAKSKASEEELKKIQKKLETKKRQMRKKEKPLSKENEKETSLEKDSKLPKINFRIP